MTAVTIVVMVSSSLPSSLWRCCYGVAVTGVVTIVGIANAIGIADVAGIATAASAIVAVDIAADW